MKKKKKNKKRCANCNCKITLAQSLVLCKCSKVFCNRCKDFGVHKCTALVDARNSFQENLSKTLAIAKKASTFSKLDKL